MKTQGMGSAREALRGLLNGKGCFDHEWPPVADKSIAASLSAVQALPRLPRAGASSLKGFGKECDRPAPCQSSQYGVVRLRRHEYGRHVVTLVSQLAVQVESRHARHCDVRDEAPRVCDALCTREMLPRRKTCAPRIRSRRRDRVAIRARRRHRRRPRRAGGTRFTSRSRALAHLRRSPTEVGR